MAQNIPQNTIGLIAAQLDMRATVIGGVASPWTPSQAMVELYPGGPTGQGTLTHLIQVTETTLSALDITNHRYRGGETWSDLQARFQELAAHLTGALRSMDLSELEKAPAIDLLPGFEESLATRHAFLLGHVFHLGYHAGQLGSLASVIGRS